MAKVKVRLTIYGPDHEHECDEAEIPGLRAQGLLIEDEPPAGSMPPAAPAVPGPAVPAVAAMTPAAAGPSKEN